MEITERDWKIFRKKIANWQERYMERLVEEYISFLQSEKPASSKFWELEKRIKQDKKCLGVLIEMRRSTEDLDEFSDELKETVRYIVEEHWKKYTFHHVKC